MHGTFKVRTDPYSLDGLIGWLEKQPPDVAYNFEDCDGNCLLGQYMDSIRIRWNLGSYELLASRIDPTVRRGHFPIGSTLPHTFGAALARARDLLS